MSAVKGGVGGPLMMLPGGVICLKDSTSAIGVAVRKPRIDRCVVMMDRTSSVLLEKRNSGFVNTLAIKWSSSLGKSWFN